MRVVGIDLGTKRIGVAVSDSGGLVATPYEVVERGRDRAGDRRRLAALIDEVEAERVVVGLPLSMDGSFGPAAQAALEEVAALRDVLAVPVETFDERLTTVSADRVLGQNKMKAGARRRVVDKVAAAVMLQAWLDSRERR
ncbi:MAG: Holliday junction resolvase RuvX [Actinobacteria bacterium]|nr:Holliday junction resolvase RuvX [Actinomycetota bacterium]